MLKATSTRRLNQKLFLSPSPSAQDWGLRACISNLQLGTRVLPRTVLDQFCQTSASYHHHTTTRAYSPCPASGPSSYTTVPALILPTEPRFSSFFLSNTTQPFRRLFYIIFLILLYHTFVFVFYNILDVSHRGLILSTVATHIELFQRSRPFVGALSQHHSDSLLCSSLGDLFTLSSTSILR